LECNVVKKLAKEYSFARLTLILLPLYIAYFVVLCNVEVVDWKCGRLQRIRGE